MGDEWREAMIKYFKMIELRVRFGALLSTPAIEIKRLALMSIIKEHKSLEEE